jgi:hypothetical protein
MPKSRVDFQQTTRRYIPEERALHNDGCENLKSYTCFIRSINHIYIPHHIYLKLPSESTLQSVG